MLLHSQFGHPCLKLQKHWQPSEKSNEKSARFLWHSRPVKPMLDVLHITVQYLGTIVPIGHYRTAFSQMSTTLECFPTLSLKSLKTQGGPLRLPGRRTAMDPPPLASFFALKHAQKHTRKTSPKNITSAPQIDVKMLPKWTKYQCQNVFRNGRP